MIAGSAISVLLYIYVLIIKLTAKTPSMIIDWFAILVIVLFQFAIPTVAAVWDKNTIASYNYQMSNVYPTLTGTALAIFGTYLLSKIASSLFANTEWLWP